MRRDALLIFRSRRVRAFCLFVALLEIQPLANGIAIQFVCLRFRFDGIIGLSTCAARRYGSRARIR